MNCCECFKKKKVESQPSEEEFEFQRKINEKSVIHINSSFEVRVEFKNLSELLKKNTFDTIAVASSNFVKPPFNDKIGEFTKFESLDRYKDYGSIYILNNHPPQVNHTIYFILPLFKNKPEDFEYLTKCFENYFNFIKKQHLTSIQLTDSSIQHFGYPRENLINEMVNFIDKIQTVLEFVTIVGICSKDKQFIIKLLKKLEKQTGQKINIYQDQNNQMIEPEQLDQSTLSTERNDSQILIT